MYHTSELATLGGKFDPRQQSPRAIAPRPATPNRQNNHKMQTKRTSPTVAVDCESVDGRKDQTCKATEQCATSCGPSSFTAVAAQRYGGLGQLKRIEDPF